MAIETDIYSGFSQQKWWIFPSFFLCLPGLLYVKTQPFHPESNGSPRGSTRCWLPRDPGFDSETTMMTWGILGIAPFFSETTKWWWGVSRYFNVILCKYKIPVKSPRNLIESPFWLDKSSEITRVQHRSTSRAAASAIPTRVVAWEKRQNSPAVVGWGLGVNIIYIKMTSTWIWLVVSNIFFSIIYEIILPID